MHDTTGRCASLGNIRYSWRASLGVGGNKRRNRRRGAPPAAQAAGACASCSAGDCAYESRTQDLRESTADRVGCETPHPTASAAARGARPPAPIRHVSGGAQSVDDLLSNLAVSSEQRSHHNADQAAACTRARRRGGRPDAALGAPRAALSDARPNATHAPLTQPAPCRRPSIRRSASAGLRARSRGSAWPSMRTRAPPAVVISPYPCIRSRRDPALRACTPPRLMPPPRWRAVRR